MSVKPIPYGLADYNTIIRKGHAYVDKTMYIRSLEQAGYYNILLRPRRFGKSLFASTLGYYYDIAEKDNFDLLFSNMDIGRNPTEEKNAYYVLKFNFSGIRTGSADFLLEDFTNKVHNGLLRFCATYHLDDILELNSPQAQLSNLFTEFQARYDGKIYVIIDEYDHFANSLGTARTHNRRATTTSSSDSRGIKYANEQPCDGYASLASIPKWCTLAALGEVRTWYEVLKEGTETVVERIFVTGVSPITLDSLTSGFNISQNLSMERGFNEMMGFTRVEVEQLIQETISEELPTDFMDTLTEYYNGYCFSEDGKERVFNSDMVLSYLNYYQRNHKPPRTLLDRNAVSDYGKLERLMRFRAPEQNRDILKEVVFDGYTTAELVDGFSIGQEFEEEHFKSLLFYLGLLTIKETNRRRIRLQIPNMAMMGLYSSFMRKIISKETNYAPRRDEIDLAMEQIAYEGSCEKFIILIEGFLRSIANQDYRKFDEKYIKLAMFAYAGMSDLYLVKSEYEIEGGGYIDLVFFSQADMSEQETLLFELKYIKKEDVPDPASSAGKKIIAAALSEATEQLREYSSAREFSGKKITCWAIVFVKDECVEQVRVPIP